MASEPYEFLTLFSGKCLNCSHLIQGGSQLAGIELVRHRCHHTDGNDNCPAQDIAIVVTGRAIRLAGLFKTAKKNGDMKRQAAILTEVADQPKAFRKVFSENIKE